MKEHKGSFICPMHGTPLVIHKEMMFGAKEITCPKCGDSHKINSETLSICPRCFSNTVIIKRHSEEILICSNPDCVSHHFNKEQFISGDVEIIEGVSYNLYSGINKEILLWSLDIYEDSEIIYDNWQYKGSYIIELIINIIRNYFLKIKDDHFLLTALKKKSYPILNGIFDEGK